MPLPEPLLTLLRQVSPFALAFSGGLDSRFLAHAAALAAGHGVRAVLFHIRGPHVPAGESREAEAWAHAAGLPLRLVACSPLERPEVRANGRDRCYHCKKYLFRALQSAVAADPAFAGHAPALCDGSNASDLLAYRPGLRALAELGVRSPLAEAGLDKNAIRRLGAASGLDRPDQTARPCLLTRFAYGLHADAAALAALDAAEAAMARLLGNHAAVPPPDALATAYVAGEHETGTGAAPLPGAPDFRLRMVGRLPGLCSSALPYKAELHIAAPLPESLLEALAACAVQQGFAVPHIRIMETVSGHYDRSGS